MENYKLAIRGKELLNVWDGEIPYCDGTVDVMDIVDSAKVFISRLSVQDAIAFQVAYASAIWMDFYQCGKHHLSLWVPSTKEVISNINRVLERVRKTKNIRTIIEPCICWDDREDE